MKRSLSQNVAVSTTAMLVVAVVPCSVFAQTTKPKYATDIPQTVTMPDSIDTRLGTLQFSDGMPDDKTART